MAGVFHRINWGNASSDQVAYGLRILFAFKYHFRGILFAMEPSLSADDRTREIADILCGRVFHLGDRVWATSNRLNGAPISGPGTIVESRTQNKNPPFPYHHWVDQPESILIRYDAVPHDSGVNNGIWTSPFNMRHL